MPRTERMIEIISEAMQRPVAQRDAFVRESCPEPGDQREAMSLLLAVQKAGRFMERPTVPAAAGIVSERSTGSVACAARTIVTPSGRRTTSPARSGSRESTTAAGQQYLIRIGGFAGDQGSGTMVLSCCYVNCDQSTSPPILNVNDFGCFLNKFAAGDPYANCDNSTAPPTLNVNDFACFLNRCAAGCS
jgi:hypothetical protein